MQADNVATDITPAQAEFYVGAILAVCPELEFDEHATYEQQLALIRSWFSLLWVPQTPLTCANVDRLLNMVNTQSVLAHMANLAI